MMGGIMRRLARDEAGISLILVVGFTMILMIFSGVVVALASQINTDGQLHQRFDLALDSAESGIDQSFGRLTADHTYSVGPNVPTGGFPTCAAGYSGTKEQCWAKQQLLNLAATQPSLLQTVSSGQYLAMRPANRQTVYAMGWSPAYGAPNVKVRMLKSEYIFAPYRPKEAILAGSSLDMSGSVLVDSPDGSPSGVHSNGDITSLPSDTIAGPVTASGNYDGRASVTNDPDHLTGSLTPEESVPEANPRVAYVTLAADPNYTNSWYDLCPDGSVHGPDTVGFQPCAGPVLSASGPYRGWSFYGTGSTQCKIALANSTFSDAPCWLMNQKDSPYSGVYYVYQGDAMIGHTGGNSSQAWNATVIAEANASGPVNPATCNKQGGNIDWELYDIQNYVTGLVLEAGADLYDSANNNASDGLFVAADQVHMHTSSATLTGAVVAADQCKGSPADSDQVQGVEIHFDETGEAPLTSIIDTTLWLEYVG